MTPEDAKKARIDPWASTQYEDYNRLMEQFGIEPFSLDGLPNPPKLFRRGVVFGQRGFSYIKSAILEKKPFAILTALMPSGKMHIGHKAVMDQCLYYQSLGADIFIGVADIESFATRGVSFEKAKEVALEEYILTYIALGLEPERCQIYFQSKRTPVKDIAFTFARKLNWSTMKAIYGFGDSTNMSHAIAPLIQVGDIIHPQLPQYGGPRPVLVPVGVDQDPHIRLSRDVANAHRLYSVTKTKDGRVGVFIKVDENVEKLLEKAQMIVSGLGFLKLEKIPKYKALYVNDADFGDIQKLDEALAPVEVEFGGTGLFPPASSYHRFLTGLTGAKMSSSDPPSAIFMTDTPEDAKKKVKRAKTGGGVTVEEHKANGGNPDECVVYELFTFHLLEDDSELDGIYSRCRAGEQMCGSCKALAAERVEKMLVGIQAKREAAREVLDQYVVYD